MNRTFSDEELRAALMGYYDAAADAAEPKPGQKFNYSPEHLAEMERLIRRKGRRGRRLLSLQRAAAVFIAFILSASVWLAVDVHAREGLFSWVRTVYEDHVEYRFRGGLSAASDELPVYELGWIPEGFELASEESGLSTSSKVYENYLTGDVIVFDYSVQNDFAQMSDYGYAKSVVVGHIKGEYYSASNEGGSNELILFDDTNGIVFHINSTLSEDDIIKIAGSVTARD